MKILNNFFSFTLALLVCASTVAAYDFGTNITIYDNRVSGSPGSWYNRGTGPGEDQEVEPGMVGSQKWDLEGFFLKDGRYLDMVGGFNFRDGAKESNTPTYHSGDIFIDTDGNAQFGSTANPSVLNYGYNYVIDVNWSNSTYNVYMLDGASSLSAVAESLNRPWSNPWSFTHTNETLITSGTFSQEKFDTDILGLQGGTHYAAEGFDLSFLPSGEFTVHFTMECGNDNLMGRGTKVPEPTALLLLGLSLIGLGVSSKKLKK